MPDVVCMNSENVTFQPREQPFVSSMDPACTRMRVPLYIIQYTIVGVSLVCNRLEDDSMHVRGTRRHAAHWPAIGFLDMRVSFRIWRMGRLVSLTVYPTTRYAIDPVIFCALP